MLIDMLKAAALATVAVVLWIFFWVGVASFTYWKFTPMSEWYEFSRLLWVMLGAGLWAGVFGCVKIGDRDE